jgi:RNA polymerase sigma factor (sigma-70 family)
MSGTGQRKSAAEGAGRAASVVSIAGSEANGTTLEGLYREYYRALVSHAGKLVGPHNAEDVVQDAFRHCWERINGGGVPNDILKRLYRTTTCRCRDLRRKLDRCENCDPSVIETLQQALLFDPLRNREVLDRLNEMVAEPESRRLIDFLLRGMTHAEIAEVERIPTGTVKSRLHALRKKLSILKNNSNPSAF